MDFGDFVFRHQLAAFVGRGDRAFDFFATLAQCFDKKVNCAAGADADVFAFGHKFDRFFGGQPFQIVLSHGVFPSKVECRLLLAYLKAACMLVNQ